MTTLDNAATELYKIPELAALGRVFRSIGPIELTESETEYVVSYIKHVMDDHVVLEFMITNTIADQLLVDVCEMQSCWFDKITNNQTFYYVQAFLSRLLRTTMCTVL